MSCGALYCRQLLRDEADLFGRSGDLTASTLARMLSTHGLDIFLQMDSETRKFRRSHGFRVFFERPFSVSGPGFRIKGCNPS